MTEYRITGGTDDTDFSWQSNLEAAVSDWTDNPIVSDAGAWERCAEDQEFPDLTAETTDTDIRRAEAYMAAIISAYADIDYDHDCHVTMNGILNRNGGRCRVEYHIETRLEGKERV